MLVVGARGAGGFAAMILGSVSRYAAHRTTCPVTVIRQASMAVHQEVAVGVRDPQDTSEALTFAFEEATARHADLVVVHAWYWFPSALRAQVDQGRDGYALPSRADLRRGLPQPVGRPGPMAGEVP